MTSKKKSQFTIRPAQATDIANCLALDHGLETATIWQMQRREEGDLQQITFQTLRLPRPIRVEYPRHPDTIRLDLAPLNGVLVAEAEGVILGYTHVVIDKSDRGAWVRHLVVDIPYRRHRIGRTLLEQAKVWAHLQGANHITLETTPRSYPAIRFLLDRGFLFCGFNERYFPSQDIAIFFGQNL
jgi:GNAT superfamily N-acetyltransferase